MTRSVTPWHRRFALRPSPRGMQSSRSRDNVETTMVGGEKRSRFAAPGRRRRTPLRLGASSGLLALLALAVVAGARQPQRDVLATATTEPATPGTTTTATVPLAPVQLPTPSSRETRVPASVSGTPVQLGLASVGSIPATALSAYQRAAAVIDAADSTCHLDWTLLAAIGQVESDHGQVNGSSLDAQGVAKPAILGPRLDGKQGISSISDTDAGRLDGDTRFDRAVGPMQFLPSTWSAVAVDGDNDGRRDPQDIDDAALASAVYLCADEGDLATNAGARAAVFRYNHSEAYVARVLAIARDLRTSGLFSAVTSGSPTIPVPGAAPVVNDPVTTTGHHGHHTHPGSPPTHWWADPPGPVIVNPGQPTGGPSSPPTDPGTPTPTDPGTPTPTDPGTPTPTDPGTPTPTDPGTPTPTTPAEAPVLTDPLPTELADLTAQQVDDYNAAWALCDDDLTAGWSADTAVRDALTQCLADEIVVAVDDTQLVAFVDWLARTEDGATG
jgi:membrane-bound lytic murein transglycosylase B